MDGLTHYQRAVNAKLENLIEESKLKLKTWQYKYRTTELTTDLKYIYIAYKTEEEIYDKLCILRYGKRMPIP